MKRNTTKRYNYFKANYDNINKKLTEIDWNASLHDCSVALNVFYDILFNVIKTNVPLTTVRSLKFPVWFSPVLIHIFKNKAKSLAKYIITYQIANNFQFFDLDFMLSVLHAKYALSGVAENSQIYIHIHVECKNCYERYTSLVEEVIKLNVNYFWKFVSNRKSPVNTVRFKNQSSENPSCIFNLFSDFSNQFTNFTL